MWRQSKGALSRLPYSKRERAYAFFEEDPVASVVARSYVEAAQPYNFHARVCYEPQTLRMSAFAWIGTSVIPLGFNTAQREQLADVLFPRIHTVSTIFGQSSQVLPLWERLSEHGAHARSLRARQFSMTISSSSLPGRFLSPSLGAIRSPRVATIKDFPYFLPAAAAMFEEELGYNPLQFGSAYRNRVKGLLTSGRSFLIMEEDTDSLCENPLDIATNPVIFKVDVGASAGGVAQLQGVWVNPRYRGQGIASFALGHVCDYLLHSYQTVSLYVNDYNFPAIAAYEKVGFRTVEEWATVLL